MKKAIILLIIIGVGFSLFWFFRNYYPQKNPTVGNTEVPSEIVIAPPPEFQEFEFQIEEATSTINIFLNETEVDIFYLILMDNDKLLQNKEEPTIWVISSFGLDRPLDISIKKKDVPHFIYFPYIIGERREGFFFSQLEKVNLESGREYYLQMIGFDKEGNLKAAAKTFKFSQK